MDNFYCELSLDMIALEAAVMNYETINNFDAIPDMDLDALEEQSATESTTSTDSDFAFGAGLFEETVANESTYPTEPALEGIGSKIWNGIKSLFASIANFFKKLFAKSEEAAKKNAEESKKVQEVMSGAEVVVSKKSDASDKPAESSPNKAAEPKYKDKDKFKDASKEKYADYDTGAIGFKDTSHAGNGIKSAVKTLADSIAKYVMAVNSCIKTTDGETILRICRKIDDAMKRLGHTNDTNVAADGDNAKAVKDFHGAYTEETYNAKTFEHKKENTIEKDADDLGRILAAAEKRIDTIDKIRSDISSTYEKLAKELDTDSYVFMVIKAGKEKRKATIDLSAYCKMEMHNGKGVDKAIATACSTIAETSKKNIAYCEKLMKAADMARNTDNAEDSAKAHAVFRLSKGYLKVSNIYGKLSNYINDAITGGILRKSVTSEGVK